MTGFISRSWVGTIYDYTMSAYRSCRSLDVSRWGRRALQIVWTVYFTASKLVALRGAG